MDEIETDVLTLVRYFARRATLASELYHELHLYGDDAGELLEAVHERYATSFDGFEFNSYFPNETEALARIVKWLGFKDRTMGSFTAKHLVEVVGRGRWFDPTNLDR